MSRKIPFIAAIALLSVGIISCGGSSSGGSSLPPPTSSPTPALPTTPPTSTATPQNIIAEPGDGSVTLRWNPALGATGYRVYYASEPNLLINNIASFYDGTRVDNVTSPLVIPNLRNDETYYFIVVAVSGTQEIPSNEVSATPGAPDTAAQPTPQEVLIVELVNRARANPGAEAARLGIGLNDGITGPLITDTPKPPLAHNLILIASSRDHSQWMLDADIFSHAGINNSEPHQRMEAAGYTFGLNGASGENIAWRGTTGRSIDLTASAALQHDGLFKSPGHRQNILREEFREIGVGQKQGYFSQEGREYLSSMLTQNFARSGLLYFLTGVVYDDKNANNFYDVGEGLSNITMSINGKSYSVYASGAYSIPVTPGNYQLTVTGDALGPPVYYSIQISDKNRKLDVIKTGNQLSVFAPDI